MRITPTHINAQLTADLQRALAALARQQSQLSAGRRIIAPSDDPGGAAQTHTIRSRQTANDQFQRNIGEARNRLESADSVLRAIVDNMAHAKELAVQGANDSNDVQARQSLATEVDQILEALVALGNSRGPRGNMLLGGQESTVAPYTVTRDGANKITAVTVNARGIDGTTAAEVSEGLTVLTSVSGTSVFGAAGDATNAFTLLIALRDNLNANDGAAVRGALDNLTTMIDRATGTFTVVGSRLGWLTALEERLQDESVVLAGSLQRVEELDLARAIQDLKQIQTTYEAGLAAGARVLQQSLLDFLR